MNTQTSHTDPISTVQALAELIHRARAATGLNARMASQLNWAEAGGPPRLVPVAPVADLLNLLSEQLEEAEQLVAQVEIVLNEVLTQNAQRAPGQ